MTIHVAHPKCPGCRKALYKSMEKGAKVSPSDEYQFCRNPACVCYGYRPDDEGGEGEAPPASEGATDVEQEHPAEAAPPSVPSAPPRSPRRQQAAQPEPAPEPEGELGEAPPEPPGEHVEVVLARARIERLVQDQGWVDGSKPPAAIGLTLALLNQATGNHDAANVLIDKYDLGRFGIRKWTAHEAVDASSD